MTLVYPLAMVMAIQIACVGASYFCDPGFTLPDAQRRVGLVHADPYPAQHLADLLAADGAFSSIQIWDMLANNAAPTLQDLQQFDAVIVWSNGAFPSPSILGDVLADYWDAGGAVVAVEFSFIDVQTWPGQHLSGRFGNYSNGYVLLDNNKLPYTCTNDQVGAIQQPLSPLMADVSSGAGTNCMCQVNIINNGILVSSWAGTGWPLVVRGTRNGRNIVDLNVYPGYWPEAALFRDALLYSMSTPCPAGYYCPDTTCPAVGRSAPQACPIGSYCPPGSTAPTQCAAGSYCPTPGATMPTTCDIGAYCPTAGLSVPTTCPAGSYCPSAGATAPTTCSIGTYCPTTGLSGPTTCPAGSYCPSVGATAPTTCYKGAYCPTAGLSGPTTCPAGSYCPSAGATAPTTCDKGAYCPTTGLAVFRPCPGGHYCSGGGAAPSACAAGFFCPAGTSVPTPCPAGRHCPAGVMAPSRCRDCREGHFRGLCGRSTKYPDGPCWRCAPCGSGHLRVGCGGDSQGTCVKMDWAAVR